MSRVLGGQLQFKMMCERPPRSLRSRLPLTRGRLRLFSPSVRGRAAEGGRGSLTRHLAHGPPYTGVAVFRFGLKKGVFTTVAGTRCRAASTVISISKLAPDFAKSRFTVASAMSFFNVGDHVVEVALPICVPFLYTGTATREAAAGIVGGRPTSS